MSTTDPNAGFKVTHQTHAEEVDENGRTAGMWKVHFETPSGVKSHIKIHDDHYSAENVGAQIAHKATEIEKVQALPDG